MRTRWVRSVAGVASIAIAVALLALALPAITGVGWSDIAAQLSALSSATVIWLGVLWFAGLWTYTFVLTGSLPGLRHSQALVLNCAGSALSNMLPFGGAAGAALTFAMAGSWGHSRRSVAISTVVSGVWNVLSRLCLPALGLTVLVASGDVTDPRLTVAAFVATAILLTALALVIATLSPHGANRWLARVARRFVPAPPARVRFARAVNAMSKLRRGAVDVIRRRWGQLTVGMFGYLGMQFLLFWACLAATSADISIGAMIAAFALSRVLATASITPGGIGVTESGTAALLVVLGAPPAPTAAALVLFGFFTHAVEIPVGGLAWVAWIAARHWRVDRQAASPSEPDALQRDASTPN